MNMRECNKCGILKHMSEYYRDGRSPDGHVHKCKSCFKEYYKARNSLSDVVTRRVARAKTPEGKEIQKKASAASRAKNPERKAARYALNRAVKAGGVHRHPCWVCGETEVEGHHPVYSMKLDVVWLCKKHHDEIHCEYGG